MKRPSFSVYRVPSVLYGEYVQLRDRLHVLLLAIAETTPGLLAFDLYSPRIAYVANKRERTAVYALAIRFAGAPPVLWASTRESCPDHDAPVERARRAHAEALGARYRLYTEHELYANEIACRNRLNLQAQLAAWQRHDTASLEVELLNSMTPGEAVPLRELLVRKAHPEALARLACYRLIARGVVVHELETRLLSDDFAISRG